MPYKITKKGEGFTVMNMNTGKTYGMHDSKDEALSQMRAMMANEGEEMMKGEVKKKAVKKAAKKLLKKS